MRTVSGKRFDDRVSRLALLPLFIFCIVGFLLGIVFIYLNVNDRISKLEQTIFPGSSEGVDLQSTEIPTALQDSSSSRHILTKRRVWLKIYKTAEQDGT